LSAVDAGFEDVVSGFGGISTVDVCVCTYHRSALIDALRSLSRQQGCHGVRVRVIVADNAVDTAARELIETTARELGLDAVYIHAPARNISIARNACLDAATAEWLAFLDDDEIATPIWLGALLREAASAQWDAILGPVRAVYPQTAPAWMRDGNFHSTRPVFVRRRIETGYTGNVMIRRAMIVREGLRFRTELGRSGGEDEDFFNRLHQAGGRIGFARSALAYEPVPVERATLSWLIRRNFRAGQSYGARLYTQSSNGLVRSAALILAAAKMSACAVAAVMHAPIAMRRNGFLMRAALHCGVVARLAGLKELSLY
jgi:succinoglycan biosynthesis protein ExoM